MTPQEIHSHWIARSGREDGTDTIHARFPYWSFSKTVLSICALKLFESQALDLDEPLDGRPFTLRQLLAHTSGLPDYGPLAAYHAAVARGETPWSREELLERVSDQGQLFSPGEGWAYSNIGYLFVRELIEEATGMPFPEVFSHMIAAPLALSSVEYWVTLEQSASLHWESAEGYHPQWVYHGCLIGSSADAARLLHSLFTGEMVGHETLHQMLDTRALGGALPDRPWTLCGYALGLMSGEMGKAGRAIGHSGGGPFCVNAVYHFPDHTDPITVACFTDGTQEGSAEYEAAEICLRQSRLPSA